MIVIKPPAPQDLPNGAVSVFLAGSIEQGSAEDWQAMAAVRLADLDGVILNPRREEWDASWPQSIEDARFRGQVEWELDGLDRADVIAMWFAPETRAPVTLLELGLMANTGKVIVGCPDGYWRKGNVEIVCKRLGVPLFGQFDEFISAVREQLKWIARQG